MSTQLSWPRSTHEPPARTRIPVWLRPFSPSALQCVDDTRCSILTNSSRVRWRNSAGAASSNSDGDSDKVRDLQTFVRVRARESSSYRVCAHVPAWGNAPVFGAACAWAFFCTHAHLRASRRCPHHCTRRTMRRTMPRRGTLCIRTLELNACTLFLARAVRATNAARAHTDA
eukprot:1059640-Pleurochrysis_carterae.AAC.1